MHLCITWGTRCNHTFLWWHNPVLQTVTYLVLDIAYQYLQNSEYHCDYQPRFLQLKLNHITGATSSQITSAAPICGLVKHNSNASFPIPFESFPIPRPCPSFPQVRPLGTTYIDLCILGARTYIQATRKQPVIKSTTHLWNVVRAPTWQPSTVHHPPSEDMAEAR